MPFFVVDSGRQMQNTKNTFAAGTVVKRPAKQQLYPTYFEILVLIPKTNEP